MTTRIVVPDHLLGDHRGSTWGDMSDYVVHLTEDPTVLGTILGTGWLKATGPYGYSHFRKLSQVEAHHSSVCFSEIPLDLLGRLTRRHGHYGIGFTKGFLRQNHGARVWYVDQHSVQASFLNSHLQALVNAGDFTNPLWDLTPFVDLMMPGRYEWDWEREWRVRGDLHFTLSDVAFVVTPEGFDELPALEGLYLHPKHDLIVAASSQPLEEYIEGLVQQFFQSFEDPANSLPVDGGEYAWIVTEWKTEEAVDDLFFDVQDGIRAQLVDYLNGLSWSWVSSDEVASIYE
ncbi:MAG TPA: hypothetical protein DCS55_21870 [Acidimicrobiaceae bacterium]|nr:hypothetical protein [Acidimicrobiaceae bacterium]